MRLPTSIELKKKSRLLAIEYGNDRYELPFEFLRVDVLEILPIGSYALQIKFSDGHDSGIYSYDYLEELGKNKDSLWQAYLEDLKAAGASRDPNDPANKRFEEPPKKKCPSHH